MALEPQFEKYLRDERESIRREVKLLFDRAARIDAILASVDVVEEPARDWVVTEAPADPMKGLDLWPMTATTTMGKCREALQIFGREATAQELRALIEHQFGAAPARSIVEMLRKRAADSRSGIYRVKRAGSPSKYGLAIWRKQGVRKTDGSHGAAEEVVPATNEAVQVRDAHPLSAG